MKKIILSVIFLIASSGLVLANNGWYSTLQGAASDVEQTPPPNGVTIAYNTTDHQWEFNYGLAPAGGTTGTCLEKNSNSDYDYSWITCSGGGGGLNSFTSPNSTITIGGTLSAPTVDINLSKANTWGALQTFGTNISVGGVTPTGATGTGKFVLSTNPSFTGTPALASATADYLSINSSGPSLSSTAITFNSTSVTNTAFMSIGSTSLTSGGVLLSNTLSGLTTGYIIFGNVSSNSYTGNGLIKMLYSGTGSGVNTLLENTNTSSSGDVLQLSNSGTGNAINVLLGKSTFAMATANASSINLSTSSGTNPSSPVSGDLWWNGTNLYFYNGSTNKDLLAGGGGGAVSSVSNTDGYLTSSPTTGAVVVGVQTKTQAAINITTMDNCGGVM